MNLTRFHTASLMASPFGERIARVLQSSLQAVDPGAAVARFLQREGDQLIAAGIRYPLSRFERILVVGAGKAGAPMAAAAERILGEVLTEGLVIVKEGHSDRSSIGRIAIREAGHPIPDESGVQATRALMELVSSAGPDDLVIALISGGGSALLLSPVEGVSLSDLQALTSTLLACGASINEINSLRKHLDAVKGGGLARLACPAQLLTLILSDVIGDPLDVIASGPTVPDSTTFTDAYRVLERYQLIEGAPSGVTAHLAGGLDGRLADTPKPGDPLFEAVQNVVVGSNLLAAQAALEAARREGLNAILLTTYLQGEARQAGRLLAAIARQIDATGQPVPRPACIVVGGETTVVLSGKGLGGRNQEVALGAASELAGLEEVFLVTLGTDGGDGPTDAAGAVVTGRTLELARSLGLDPDDSLQRNDSYHFFSPLGDLLKTGPTQTNVNDLAFLFIF